MSADTMSRTNRPVIMRLTWAHDVLESPALRYYRVLWKERFFDPLEVVEMRQASLEEKNLSGCDTVYTVIDPGDSARNQLIRISTSELRPVSTGVNRSLVAA